jgi:hypothetical protein
MVNGLRDKDLGITQGQRRKGFWEICDRINKIYRIAEWKMGCSSAGQ